MLMIILALAGPLLSLPARADTTGSFAGTVAYVNRTHIGVKSGTQTRDYLIPSDFNNVTGRNGKVAYSTIKTGEFVTVQYTQSPLFGSTRATKIIIGFPLTMPSTSP
jgi:hypothetical protein